jgi:DNA-binding transcriptional MocR family regulator
MRPSLFFSPFEQNIRRADAFSFGNVIYLSTLSKTLATGLRLGWIVAPTIVAPTEVIGKVTQLKQGESLGCSLAIARSVICHSLPVPYCQAH